MRSNLDAAFASKGPDDSMLLIQHDTYPRALELTQYILDKAQEKGWRAVTVAECLDANGGNVSNRKRQNPDNPIDYAYQYSTFIEAGPIAVDGCIVTEPDFCGQVQDFDTKEECFASEGSCLQQLEQPAIQRNQMSRGYRDFSAICYNQFLFCAQCDTDGGPPCDPDAFTFRRPASGPAPSPTGTTTIATSSTVTFTTVTPTTVTNSSSTFTTVTPTIVTTTNGTSTTVTLPTSSSSIGPSPPTTCYEDNCYRNMMDPRYSASATPFCSTFTASGSTNVPIPTYLDGCDSNSASVSSACSCIVPPAPSSTVSTLSTVTPTGVPVTFSTITPDPTTSSDDGLSTSTPITFANTTSTDSVVTMANTTSTISVVTSMVLLTATSASVTVVNGISTTVTSTTVTPVTVLVSSVDSSGTGTASTMLVTSTVATDTVATATVASTTVTSTDTSSATATSVTSADDGDATGTASSDVLA